MITAERKLLLMDLAKSGTLTIKTMGASTPEETEFVINTMAKAEAYGFTIETIKDRCMEVLRDTLFGDKKELSERVERLEKRVENLCEGERLKED